jgi:hypothetical protein
MSEGRIDKLERLAKLREAASLTGEEFEAEKAKVLNASVAEDVRLKRYWWRITALSLGLAVALFATAKLLIDEQFTASPAPPGPSSKSRESGRATSGLAAPLQPATTGPEDRQVGQAKLNAEAQGSKQETSVAPQITDNWWTLRTRIRDGWGSAPSFANRYVIIRIGCGAGCTINVVGDHVTGKLYSLGLGGRDQLALDLKFDNTSNIIEARWRVSGTASCITQNYYWSGSSLTTVGERSISPASGNLSCIDLQ